MVIVQLALSLSKVWVPCDDIPSGMHSFCFLLAFGELIGKPIEVDMASLDHLGHARMKVWCLEPARVHSFVDVFPASTVYHIRVRVEGMAPHRSLPPSTQALSAWPVGWR